MRRNLIAGLLIAAGLVLVASALPALGLFRTDAAPLATPIVGLNDPLSPPHQHPRLLAGTGSTGVAPSQVIAYVSIPKIGVKNAPVYDRGVDPGGNMLIAKGYAITHFALSSPLGSGNAVLYGHDDIEGSVFGRLKDLQTGDEIDVLMADGTPAAYRVSAKAIMAPSAVQILQPTNDVRLTLFTCWPNWVDTQRVVVTASPANSST